MEKFDIPSNKWTMIKVRLNEGRYHASACFLASRYIYVFGGYWTKKLRDHNKVKIERKNEVVVNVQSMRVELYDTHFEHQGL
jgi:N-acetylneuraminic acid mutarotase